MSLFFNLPGMFVAWGLNNDTWSAEQLVSQCLSAGVKWLAVEVPENDAATISELRAAMQGKGIYFGIWEVAPTSLDLLNTVKPNFWLLNVESPGDYSALLKQFRAEHPLLPAGLVTNCDIGDPSPWLQANIRALPEAYQPDNLQATPAAMAYRMRQMGWTYVFPVLGCYHGYPLSAYTVDGQVNGFSVYLAEEMSDADWQTYSELHS